MLNHDCQDGITTDTQITVPKALDKTTNIIFQSG